MKRFLWLAALVFGCLPTPLSAQWKMHVIDNTSRGADGVRLADFNNDKLPDIVTGWEEGGVIRVYRNPGHDKATSKWPLVTVGQVKSPEDAVFADLNGDGNQDVISCCEGKTQAIHIHWAPKNPFKYMESDHWVTESIPAVEKKSSWMFAAPADIDGKNGIDFFVGSKGKNACVGWLESPEKPMDVSKWKFHKLEDAGWIMSLRVIGSGKKLQLLVSDRKGPKRGVYFLSKPTDISKPWQRSDLNSEKLEFMFLDYKNEFGTDTVRVATRNKKIVSYHLTSPNLKPSKSSLTNPDQIGNGKAVAIGDIDLDGKMDIVHSCNTQSISKSKKVSGMHWIGFAENTKVTWRPIADSRGRKYDRIELLDLDGDGDLDVLTCEEAANLGVIWFENPTK